MDIHVYADNRLLSKGRSLRCALGTGGVTGSKCEGDGATPTGCFPLRRVLYRADRVTAPKTALPVAALAPDDSWCNDPVDRNYNRPVKRPYAASHEMLWRDDHLYDVIVAIGHNDDPPRPGAGSAIFLHCARDDFTPTDGCVALRRADLLDLLQCCRPGDRLCVHCEDAPRAAEAPQD